MRCSIGHSLLLAIGFAIAATQVMAKDVEIVPAWSVLVLDAAGKPVSDLKVYESWEFFGFSSSGTDSRVTDSAGRVTFPRRSFSVNEVSYKLSQGASHLNVHASFGGTGSVMIHPQGQKVVQSHQDTDGKTYDDPGADTHRTKEGFQTTLQVLARDVFDFVYHREWDAVKRSILENPSTISMRSRGGSTLLILVAGEQFSGQAAEVLQLLVEKGADLNAQANDGKTALHCAAENCDLAEMEYLLGHKANPNLKMHDSVYYTENGFTPLHFEFVASGNKSPSVVDRIKAVDLLLKHGADINAKDATGNTSLHLAAVYGNPDIVSALLARGADSGAVNLTGQTPLASIQSLQDTPPVRQVKALLRQHREGDPTTRQR